MNESDLELILLDWLQEQGYTYVHGNDISPGGLASERYSYDEVILKERLYNALRRINSYLPEEAIEEAMQRIIIPQHPGLLQNNH